MSPATVSATILTLISIHLVSSSLHFTLLDTGSQCEEFDTVCELNEMKLKVAGLEAVLEEKSDNLESRSRLLDNLELRNDDSTAEILKLESRVEELKGVQLLHDNEAVRSLEIEVRSLWATSRRNNFDLHILEAKVVEAEERLEDAKSEVEKMADIVTEQWIKYRHLEQALLGVKVKTVESERQLCLKKCSFFERLPLLLDQHLSQQRPAMKFYWFKVLNQINMFPSEVKKYHLKLQQFIRQEMEKTQLTAVYTSEELIFFVASGLLIFPLLCALMMLLSLFH